MYNHFPVVVHRPGALIFVFVRPHGNVDRVLHEQLLHPEGLRDRQTHPGSGIEGDPLSIYHLATIGHSVVNFYSATLRMRLTAFLALCKCSSSCSRLCRSLKGYFHLNHVVGVFFESRFWLAYQLQEYVMLMQIINCHNYE